MPEKKSAITKERIDPKTGKKIVTIRKKKKPEAKAPAKSSKAAFVKIEIAKGNLKKENGKIVEAKAPVQKKKIVEAKAPVQGPRNLVKGFGIKRKPKAKPAPKAKATPKPKGPVKKLGKKWTYKVIVDENPETFLYPAEENAGDNSYRGLDWITGVSPAMDKFYRGNQYKYDQLSQKQQERIDKIEDIVRDNMRPSLERELKRFFKQWKEKNADKLFTEKEAIDSFDSFYF